MIGTVQVHVDPATGTKSGNVDLHAGPDDTLEEKDVAWSRYVDHAMPALLWLAAQGGGLMVLPLGDGESWRV